jgi:thioredoxin 1
MKKWLAMVLPLMLAVASPSVCSSAADTTRTDGKQAVTPASGKKVTLIELGSVKCSICQMMQIIIKEIEKEYRQEVNVVFHNVRSKGGRPLAEKYGISMIPTQVFLDENGKEFFRHEGYFPKDEIIKVLKMKGVDK